MNEKINRENLCTALRCFFEIERNAKPHITDTVVCLRLAEIYRKVSFAEKYRNEPNFYVFEKWIRKYRNVAVFINTEFWQPLKPTPELVSKWKLHKIKVHFINLLTAEICAGLNAGLYQLQPFKPTKREMRKIEAEKLKQYGITMPKKPRNTKKQALTDYDKHCETLFEKR